MNQSCTEVHSLENAARSAASARSADRKADQQGVVVQHCGIPWVSPGPLLKGWHDFTFSHVLLSVLRRETPRGGRRRGSGVQGSGASLVRGLLGSQWVENLSVENLSGWCELVVGYAQPLDALVVIKPQRRRRLCMSRARSEGRGG